MQGPKHTSEITEANDLHTLLLDVKIQQIVITGDINVPSIIDCSG